MSKEPITERTNSRGLVELVFPWVGGEVELTFPATNRSIMVIAVSLLIAATIIIPTCAYIIFVAADAENIRSVNRWGRDNKPEISSTPDNDKIPSISVLPSKVEPIEE